MSAAYVCPQNTTHFKTVPPPPASIIQSKELLTRNTGSKINLKKTDVVRKYLADLSSLILSLWKGSSTTSLFYPSRSFKFFLEEVVRRSRCSLSALQLSVYYLCKLPASLRSGQCPKRLLLACVMLAFKFLYDSNYSMASWSRISGLSVSELKKLELDILKKLDYTLHVPRRRFENWVVFLNKALQSVNSTSEAEATSVSHKRKCLDTGLPAVVQYKRTKIL